MKRTLVIGDIHGGLKALKQVMERAGVTADDRLVFLGDLVDGWSESAQVIDFALQLARQQECIFIKGNHDEWCEQWLRTGVPDHKWLPHGGMETIKSYDGYDQPAKDRHLDFIRGMNYYEIDLQNRLFIHAGFTSMHGPQAEFHASNFSWDRTLWEMAMAMDKQLIREAIIYPKRLKLFSEIFIGHTPTTNFNCDIPMNGANVWNIDTGAAFKGRLSIMDADTKTYWQSDPLPGLYPGEIGRNK